jgi:hypothetical protein
MSDLISIFGGFILGAMGVGLPTLRTMKVIEGSYATVFVLTLICSANLFIFTNVVVTKNYLFMICNAIGAAISVSYIAYREKKKLDAKSKL